MTYTPVSSQDIDLEGQTSESNSPQTPEPPAYQFIPISTTHTTHTIPTTQTGPTTSTTPSICTRSTPCAACTSATAMDHTHEYLLELARTHQLTSTDLKFLHDRNRHSTREVPSTKLRHGNYDENCGTMIYRFLMLFVVLAFILAWQDWSRDNNGTCKDVIPKAG
jgi:hypothetical protein